VLIACWSPKGGSGTTVVSAALALVLSASTGPTLVADLAGDVPAALGLPGADGPGLADWLVAGPDVPDDALARLEVEVGPRLHLLPWGTADADREVETRADALASGRAAALAAALAADRRSVVADCGRAASGPGLVLAAGASVSLLVLRPCYLALRRAEAAPIRPSGVILVNEEGRSLTRRDVEEVLGVPVRAEIPYEPAVARAVDAGLLTSRVPRNLERPLRRAA
jgi:MinD-like ATPase involved in chromosome partitioning or flagellar assembly